LHFNSGVVTTQTKWILNHKVQEASRVQSFTGHSSSSSHDRTNGGSADSCSPASRKKSVEVCDLTEESDAERNGGPAAVTNQIPIIPTKLFSRNNDVDSYNMTQLQRLDDSEVTTYTAKDEGQEPFLKQLKQVQYV